MTAETKRDPRAGINIKVRPELRARANICATLEGLTVPEFVRAAIVAHCERSEKLHGQRTRAAKAAAGMREGGWRGGRATRADADQRGRARARGERIVSGPKAVCPKCGGEGGHWGADGFEPCDGCGGTGRAVAVPREAAAKAGEGIQLDAAEVAALARPPRRKRKPKR